MSASRQGLHEFGLSERLAGPVGIVLPVVELVVAVCLLVSALAWWGALAALALLVLFFGGMRSTVLLDHVFDTGAAFGAGGTPMAVLDRRRGQGRLARGSRRRRS